MPSYQYTKTSCYPKQQNMGVSKQDHIIIVGAGAFGLSTALHLSQNGYSNITVLEQDDEVPSRYSAANDLNKIMRVEYEDPWYTDLTIVSELPSPLGSHRVLRPPELLDFCANHVSTLRKPQRRGEHHYSHHTSTGSAFCIAPQARRSRGRLTR